VLSLEGIKFLKEQDTNSNRRLHPKKFLFNPKDESPRQIVMPWSHHHLVTRVPASTFSRR